MKPKIALLAAVIAFSYTNAQENPYTDIHMRNYSKKIDSIIVSEKAKMNNELDDLEKTFKENKLSAEEKQKQKTEVAKKYEQIINGKVDDEKVNLENATRELVKSSVMGKGKVFDQIGFAQNNAILSFRDTKRTKKELLKADDLNISFAFPNLTKSAGSLNLANKSSEAKFGKSTSTVFEYRATRQFGALTSPVFYRIGLGLRSDTYGLDNSKVFVQQDRQIYLTDFTQGNLKKSRISNYYVTVPIDFVFVLNPKYTTENDVKMLDNSKGNFRVSAGVYGGVRYLSQNQIIYKNFEDHRTSYRENINGSVNNFLFGGKISLGYGALNVFVKKDFTPIFNDNAKINNKYGIQIGLELLYINF
ncbi:MAG: hypothetical protein K0R77_1791 [Chryseobacterium sp.]|jgi:hypothetical protein|uniref:hypothetical protein n=1 Tax=Chryseobacterium sp. TaxID=1871047 RepID=UPI00261A14A5|nr:hypothetical protein [Chryseobacterium sp.]MDF2552516.1 hypothetical protein [Chryseobacterium sp.]